MNAPVHNVALVAPGLAATPAATLPGPAGTAPLTGPSFAEVLAERAGAAAAAPSFSRHALERIAQRGITVDPSTLQRLAGGMSRAAAKGSRDSVVFVDNTAFVVSVPNNTVITAVDSEHMRQHVFTNIDSAVIA